jgi:hypothetical protein
MGTTYEIWCGGRLVSIRNTHSSRREAVTEYLRSLGGGVDEIVRHSEESSPAAVANWLRDDVRRLALAGRI